jgi:NAD(P)H-flavin reductase
VATGTGLAPFLAMIAAERLRTDSPGVTLLHGVAYQTELGHRERLAAWRAEGLPLAYLPTVSRPADSANAGWGGAFGRVDRLLDEVCNRRGLTPTTTVVYLCGNPDMVETCRARLEGRGFGPADVRAELFQAVARTARRPAAPRE